MRCTFFWKRTLNFQFHVSLFGSFSGVDFTNDYISQMLTFSLHLREFRESKKQTRLGGFFGITEEETFP